MGKALLKNWWTIVMIIFTFTFALMGLLWVTGAVEVKGIYEGSNPLGLTTFILALTALCAQKTYKLVKILMNVNGKSTQKPAEPTAA